MTTLRLLVGTRKGAFVLTSDERRQNWKVDGPHFAGWEVYHVNGSPADPNRLYASTSRGWFGQVIQRSDDGGATWQPTGNEFHYEGTPGTHKWYDNTDHPWEFARVWHFEPSLTDPDTVYAGVEDAALFKSTNGGVSWEEWLQKHRTELNAMTTQQFIDWLNAKMADYVGKLIPPENVIAAELEQGLETTVRAKLTARILRVAKLDEQAKKLRLGLSDVDIAQRITSDANFLGPNGKFDRARFEQVIRQAGFSEIRYVDEQRSVG